MQLAKVTGTLDDKLAENSSPDETNPMSAMGGGGGGGFGGGGQEGGGSGGGRRGGINPDDLGLNEEQKEKWEKATEKRRTEMRSMFTGGGRGEGGSGGGGSGRGGSSRDFYAQLDLTEDQQAKVEAIQETQSAERQKMFEELRNGGGDREANRAKFMELREKFDKQTQAVLTDAQKKKLAEVQVQRGQTGNRPGGGPGGGSDGVRERFAKVWESFEKDVQAFLTEEQFKKYKNLSAQSRGRRGGGGSGRGGPGEGGQGRGRADRGGRESATGATPAKPKGNSDSSETPESRGN
jgi:Spy/CpxP family protein refolding chaperone